MYFRMVIVQALVAGSFAPMSFAQGATESLRAKICPLAQKLIDQSLTDRGYQKVGSNYQNVRVTQFTSADVQKIKRVLDQTTNQTEKTLYQLRTANESAQQEYDVTANKRLVVERACESRAEQACRKVLQELEAKMKTQQSEIARLSALIRELHKEFVAKKDANSEANIYIQENLMKALDFNRHLIYERKNFQVTQFAPQLNSFSQSLLNEDQRVDLAYQPLFSQLQNKKYRLRGQISDLTNLIRKETDLDAIESLQAILAISKAQLEQTTTEVEDLVKNHPYKPDPAAAIVVKLSKSGDGFRVREKMREHQRFAAATVDYVQYADGSDIYLPYLNSVGIEHRALLRFDSDCNVVGWEGVSNIASHFGTPKLGFRRACVEVGFGNTKECDRIVDYLPALASVEFTDPKSNAASTPVKLSSAR